MDANWITESAKLSNEDWPHLYWAGQSFPNLQPIWEALVSGRILILGTALRNKSRELIEKHFPKSVVLAETARMAAWEGFDLGNVSGFLLDRGEHVELQYAMDWREEADEKLRHALMKMRNNGEVVVTPAFLESLKLGVFHTPDFRPFGYTRPKASMPLT